MTPGAPPPTGNEALDRAVASAFELGRLAERIACAQDVKRSGAPPVLVLTIVSLFALRTPKAGG